MSNGLFYLLRKNTRMGELIELLDLKKKTLQIQITVFFALLSYLRF